MARFGAQPGVAGPFFRNAAVQFAYVAGHTAHIAPCLAKK